MNIEEGVNHYVIGIDDNYIAQGTYNTLPEAVGHAEDEWLRNATWKVDIEAHDLNCDTLWVLTWREDEDRL